MSDFWLGAWLALAVWKFINAVLTGFLLGKEVTVDTQNVLWALGQMCLFLLLAVLAYVGVGL